VEKKKSTDPSKAFPPRKTQPDYLQQHCGEGERERNTFRR
jgi:hypothetical protein